MASEAYLYGILGNVSLTIEHHSELFVRMGPEAQHYIDQLSVYLPNRTKPAYKNHFAVIIQWWLKDRRTDEGLQQAKSKPGPRKPTYAEDKVERQHQAGDAVRQLLSGTTGHSNGQGDH